MNETNDKEKCDALRESIAVPDNIHPALVARFKDGFCARMRGQDRDANPWSMNADPLKFGAWDLGWVDARNNGTAAARNADDARGETIERNEVAGVLKEGAGEFVMERHGIITTAGVRTFATKAECDAYAEGFGAGGEMDGDGWKNPYLKEGKKGNTANSLAWAMGFDDARAPKPPDPFASLATSIGRALHSAFGGESPTFEHPAMAGRTFDRPDIRNAIIIPDGMIEAGECDAYRDGAVARLDGVPMGDCPYPEGHGINSLRTSWLTGWEWATIGVRRIGPGDRRQAAGDAVGRYAPAPAGKATHTLTVSVLAMSAKGRGVLVGVHPLGDMRDQVADSPKPDAPSTLRERTAAILLERYGWKYDGDEMAGTWNKPPAWQYGDYADNERRREAERVLIRLGYVYAADKQLNPPTWTPGPCAKV